uniref:Uncharacterized protein n=1 Tax=Solanum lycopersicum TaxID=4081 RepID=K4BSC2_SOLLC
MGFEFRIQRGGRKSGRVLGVRNLVGRLSEKSKRGKESCNSGD